MITSMRFRENSTSFDVSEVFDNGCVRVSFWTASPNSYGSIDLQEAELIELSNWINRQIAAISKKKPSQITKSTK